MTREDVGKAIAAISAVKDHNELSEVVGFLRDHLRRVERDTSGSFSVGDKVLFDGRSRGKIHGTVTKVNRSKVIVRSSDGMPYSVSSLLLRRDS